MKKKYFNYEEKLNRNPNMVYYIVFGERDAGKNYSAKQQMLKTNLITANNQHGNRFKQNLT